MSGMQGQKPWLESNAALMLALSLDQIESVGMNKRSPQSSPHTGPLNQREPSEAEYMTVQAAFVLASGERSIHDSESIKNDRTGAALFRGVAQARDQGQLTLHG